MADDFTPAEELGTGARRDIFMTLLTAGEPQTPSEISESIDTTRQQVQYHLNILVRMGLAVPGGEAVSDSMENPPDDGEYVAQPALLSEELPQNVEAALLALIPAVEESAVIPEDVDDEETVIGNCVKMAVALQL